MRSTLLPAILMAAVVAALAPVASAVDPLVLDAEARRVEVIADISRPTVSIFADAGEGGGSGVLISPDGYTVTNFHVVASLGPFMKCGLNDGEIYDAVLVGLDPTGDVALIRLLGREDFPVAQIGDSDTVRVGDWAYAVGNPFLLATDFQPTVTYGIVSGVHRYQEPAGTFLEYTDCIQVDASINPGNSGGPLFNEEGQLIGINGRASFEKKGRVNIGAGYAISINQVLNFLDHLKSGRVVDHATLGATVQTQGDGSVIVNQILESSDVYRRGLRGGDELVSFAGRPIRSVNQFKNILGIYPKGWQRPLVYRRDGEKHEIMVRLEALHTAAELNPDRATPLEPPQRPGDDGEDPDRRPRRPGDPRQPQPVPLPGMQHTPEVPEQYADLFIERRGFANDYFNRLHRDRLYAGIKSLGSFPGGTWELAGRTAAGDAFHFKLRDTAAALEQAADLYYQPEEEPPGDQPPGSGGLLTGVYHFRQMLLGPEDRFTEYYYLGSEPLDGHGERVDVLITTRGTVTGRWYFSRPDGELLGFDTQLEADVDPCEVRITGWKEFDGRRLPAGFTVQHGDEDVGTYAVESVRMEGANP